jgi:hypothetical protein
MFRIHAASLQAGSTRAGQLFSGVFDAVRGIPETSTSGTSHP